MGIKERRERERREQRQGILAAARAIASHEGWQAVTIRRVAEQVEYSPPMIYEHFASKEALLLELVRAGFQALLSAMREAAEPLADPAARVLALADAYWAFAWANPAIYQAMHGLGGVPFCLDQAALVEGGQPIAEAGEVFEYTLATLERRLPPGTSRADLESAVLILWATLHGLVALTMANCVFGGREQASGLVGRAVQGLLAGPLGLKPAATATKPAAAG